MREQVLEDFQRKHAILFSDKALLDQALTHSSYVRQKQHKKGMKDNEKLEFFGDAVLKLLVSEYLYIKYPDWNEGTLTKIRAYLISDKFLAKLALQLGLGAYIQFSFGERNSGGATRASNLANAFEALLGAYYIDQGLESVRRFLLEVLQQSKDGEAIEDFMDYKTQLQEWAQQQKLLLPNYRLTKAEGPDHCKVFHVTAHIQKKEHIHTFDGIGQTKKEAEQHAAKQACEALKIGDSHGLANCF